MHYVIGDVHESYDEMLALMDKIEEKDPNAEFIFVGDFIDRGNCTKKMLNWCMENITPDGKYQSVRGNHEDMILEWWRDWLKWWNTSETRHPWGKEMPRTAFGFSWALRCGYKNGTPEKIRPYIDFIEGLPLEKVITVKSIYGKDVTYRIAHADHCYEENASEHRKREQSLWSYNYKGNLNDKEILVHGHFYTASEHFRRLYTEEGLRPGLIAYAPNDINVDGGCAYDRYFWDAPCMLCAICLENLEEIYLCSIEERFLQKGTRHSRKRRISTETAIKRADEYRKRYLSKAMPSRDALLERLK